MSAQKTPGQIEILQSWIQAASVFTAKCGEPFEFVAFVEETARTQKALQLKGGNDLRPAYGEAMSLSAKQKFENIDPQLEFVAQHLMCRSNSKFSEDIHAVSGFIILEAIQKHVLETRDLSPKIADMLMQYKIKLQRPSL